jgi:hypothetical protein
LVPAGHHYYEGSDFCQPPLTNPPTTIVSFSHPAWSLAEGAWNILKRRSSSLILTIDSGLSVELAVLPAYLV